MSKLKLENAIKKVNYRFLNGLNDDDQVKEMLEIANKTKGYHFSPRYDTFELVTDKQRLIELIDKYGYWSEEVKKFNEILTLKGGHHYMTSLNVQTKP